MAKDETKKNPGLISEAKARHDALSPEAKAVLKKSESKKKREPKKPVRRELKIPKVVIPGVGLVELKQKEPVFINSLDPPSCPKCKIDTDKRGRQATKVSARENMDVYVADLVSNGGSEKVIESRKFATLRCLSCNHKWIVHIKG